MYEALVEKFKKVFKENLVATIRFGSEGEPHNMLVVLNTLDYDVLQQIKLLLKEYSKKVPTPIFFTKKELTQAADVFPLEFLDVKYPHELLYGEDIIEKIKFDKRSVRQQIEFELRSKLIHLREHYIWIKTPDELRALLLSAIPSLMPLCYGLLFLKNVEPPTELDALFDCIKEHYKINITILKKIRMVKKARDIELHLFVQELMQFLSMFIEIVDKIKV